MSTGAVVVFGREPRAGRVKTRLARSLGGEPAAEIYRALLDYTLGVAQASDLRVVLSLAAPASRQWAAPSDVAMEVQSELDLGQRMAEAFARRFEVGEDRVVVIGSDCPWITVEHLQDAVAGLDRGEVVLGPADDGGYWLVAQRAPGTDLFSGIPWSMPKTLERTRNRLQRLGCSWCEIDELVDIDTAADLERALADPRTPAALRERLHRAVSP